MVHVKFMSQGVIILLVPYAIQSNLWIDAFD